MNGYGAIRDDKSGEGAVIAAQNGKSLSFPDRPLPSLGKGRNGGLLQGASRHGVQRNVLRGCPSKLNHGVFILELRRRIATKREPVRWPGN